jgi:hypothetical protein
MATRYEERPRERERAPVPEEELRLEPMLADRDYEKLYGMRAWLRDRVRLAPVFAGVFIAFATTIFLSAFGIWIGIITAPTTPTGGLPIGLAAGLGVWAGVSTWLAGRIDGILNGVAVWGLFITGGVLLSSFTSLLGVGSLVTFTIGGGSTLDLLRALNLSALATVTPDQAAAIRGAVTDASLFVWIGTLVGAGFAVLGGWLGARSRKVSVPPSGEPERT